MIAVLARMFGSQDADDVLRLVESRVRCDNALWLFVWIFQSVYSRTMYFDKIIGKECGKNWGPEGNELFRRGVRGLDEVWNRCTRARKNVTADLNPCLI